MYDEIKLNLNLNLIIFFLKKNCISFRPVATTELSSTMNWHQQQQQQRVTKTMMLARKQTYEIEINMAGNGAVLLKVVASSVAIARRAGVIIRSILKSGDLAVVDKV